MPFASVYPAYVNKAVKKGRTQEEVDRVICWLTGYDEAGLRRLIAWERRFFRRRFAVPTALGLSFMPRPAGRAGFMDWLAKWRPPTTSI